MKRIFPLLLGCIACCVSSASFAAIVADSSADWSADGTQGVNGWTYGVYNATTDANGTYDAGDFEAFDGTTYIWNGSKWDENNADGDNVPWTEVAQDSGHPNGDNNGEVHYAIRRWEATGSGAATINYNISKANVNCGNGATALLYHNGAEIAKSTIAGADGTGVMASAMANISAGDHIDLALSSFGDDDTFNDGCDGSNFGFTVDLAAAPAPAGLWVDFNSTTQDSGPHPQAGYQSYDAGHEVAADFVRMDYNAFGGMVGVTPDWPNTTDNRVRQMIDRGGNNDAQWLGADIDLLTDFLGIDARTGNGGNGDWGRDGASEPTQMTLALSDLPAGEYNWKSFHHDTENVWADFQVEVSTDGGATFTDVGDFEMSSTSTGGNPANAGLITEGPVSMVETSFSATGSDDVVLRFSPFADGVDPSAVHKQIFGINGFQLNVVPEPGANLLLVMGVVALLGARRRR